MTNRVVVTIACLSAVVIACGGSPAPDTTTEPVVNEPPVEGASQAAAAESVFPVWIEPPIIGSRVLFGEERYPITNALAEVLPAASRGELRVIPPSELRDIQTKIRSGKLPGITSACPALPPPMALLEHLHKDAGKVDVVIACEAECTLKVSVYAAEHLNDKGYPRRDELMFFEAPLPKGATVDAWAEAIREKGLTRVEGHEWRSGGLGLRGRTGDIKPGEYALDLTDLKHEGDWATKLDSTRFDPHVKTLHQCTQTDAVWRDWWSQPFIIEVDEAGRVIRCETKYPYRLDPPEFTCRCKEIKKINFGKGPRDRRAEFNIHTYLGGDNTLDRSASVHIWAHTKLKADDPSVLLGRGEIDTSAIKKCLSSLGKAIDLEVPIGFEVGPDGRTMSQQTTWPEGLPPGVTRCIGDALRPAHFTCPLTGRATVEGTLVIKVKKRK